MSVLKIKDQNNNWTQIPTIKGDKGDPFTYADFTPEQLESLKGKDGISPTVSVASDTSEDYRLSFTDETHTVTTPNLIPEAEKIFSVYPHDTASGSIASFSDGADNIPLKSCIVQIEPVQSGSGDPSPDNIRPISGWTGCEVQRTGKNLLNINLINGYVDISDILKVGVTYTASAEMINSATPTFCYLRKKKPSESDYTNVAFIIANTTVGAKTFTVEEGYNYYIYCNSSYTNVKNMQIEVGSTASPYEPYQGQICPITFPSEAGTIYGGYVDVLNGELVIDKAYALLNDPDMWKVSAGTVDFEYTKLFADRKKYDNSYKGLACSYMVVSSAGQTSLTARWKGAIDNSFGLRWRGGTLEQVKSDASAGKIAICYELATPIEMQLDAHTIKTLLGTNNIWADTGDVSVEYRASTKMYIDRKITEAVASALNS